MTYVIIVIQKIMQNVKIKCYVLVIEKLSHHLNNVMPVINTIVIYSDYNYIHIQLSFFYNLSDKASSYAVIHLLVLQCLFIVLG